MAGHLGKYRSLMPSLALLLHLVEIADGKPGEPVSLTAARMAASWCSYLETHAQRVYGLMTERVPTVAAKIVTGCIGHSVHRQRCLQKELPQTGPSGRPPVAHIQRAQLVSRSTPEMTLRDARPRARSSSAFRCRESWRLVRIGMPRSLPLCRRRQAARHGHHRREVARETELRRRYRLLSVFHYCDGRMANGWVAEQERGGLMYISYEFKCIKEHSNLQMSHTGKRMS